MAGALFACLFCSDAFVWSCKPWRGLLERTAALFSVGVLVCCSTWREQAGGGGWNGETVLVLFCLPFYRCDARKKERGDGREGSSRSREAVCVLWQTDLFSSSSFGFLKRLRQVQPLKVWKHGDSEHCGLAWSECLEDSSLYIAQGSKETDTGKARKKWTGKRSKPQKTETKNGKEFQK